MPRRRSPEAFALVLSGQVLCMFLFLFLLGQSPAYAANADACGVVTQRTISSSFGLTRTAEDRAVLRRPGNPAGVLHARCRTLVWSGRKPTDSKGLRAALGSGGAAQLRIETWVPDSGPAAQHWLVNFPKKLKGLLTRARAEFLQGTLHGRTVSLPRFGAASSLAYEAPSGEVRKLRAFWWDRNAGVLVTFNVVQDRSQPVTAGLRALAAKIVPGVDS